MGGADEPEIHCDRGFAAQALQPMFLQHTQQLGLHRQRHVADFVQEQGAALRLLEVAAPGLGRAGEGALFVAEQFGLDQALRNRRAIDRDEGRLAAGGMLMEHARHMLLADPGLAGDEQGVGVASEAGQGFGDALHRRRHTQALASAGAFPGSAVALGQRTNLRDQGVRIEGLGDVVGGAGLDQRDRTVDRPECGHL